jgi:hypothetical protein
MPKQFECLFCPKHLDTFEDLLHHVELDHVGMDAKVLHEATSARETKKQLGNYLDIKKKGVGLECPVCFEMLNSIEKLVKHADDIHNKELDPKFIETLQKMIQENPDTPPICQRCNTHYFGLITTKINNLVQNVCFNCYEKYFGTNALNRITIGTPDSMIKKMRTPIISSEFNNCQTTH